MIERIIFTELSRGIFTKDSKAKLIEIIEKYDTEGVVLGCTELPLILKESDTKNKPFINTLKLHANAALERALT